MQQLQGSRRIDHAAVHRLALEAPPFTALTNVTRYANAQVCHVELAVEERALRISVADDGDGLDRSVWRASG